MQYITTVSQKGQIVVPKKLRDKLNIKVYDTLSVSMKGKSILVKPVFSTNDVFGMFKAKEKISKNDIKKTFAKKTLQKHKV